MCNWLKKSVSRIHHENAIGLYIHREVPLFWEWDQQGLSVKLEINSPNLG